MWGMVYKVGMPMVKKRRRRYRSVRKLNAFLLAFGLTALCLGGVLVLYFVVRGQFKWAGIGGVYVLVAGVLLGLRGVLVYQHEQRKVRHATRRD
jgi:membrane protein implicated in regulation of membrane protease activity